MPQEVRRRQHATVNYSLNAKVNATLGRGMIYRHLMLRLQGAPTLSAANNTQAKTKKAEEWAVVKRIDIIANGSDVLKSLSGEALWWHNYLLFGAVPRVTATLGDGSTANVAFDSMLILPFWMLRGIKPFDTALDAQALSDLKIEITWGTFSDVNGDATGWTTEPSLEVYSLESFNPPANAAFSQWRIFEIEKTITAATTQFDIDLSVGPLYRGFVLNTVSDDVDVATILNNIKLISGTTVYADLRAEVLRDEYRVMNGIPLDEVARRSTSSSAAGWFVLDMVTDGRLSEGIDSLGLAELKLQLDVAAPGTVDKVRVWPQQIIPVRGFLRR